MKFNINAKKLHLLKLLLIFLLNQVQITQSISNYNILKSSSILTLGGISLIYLYNQIYNSPTHHQKIIDEAYQLLTNQEFINDINVFTTYNIYNVDRNSNSDLNEKIATKLIPAVNNTDASTYLEKLSKTLKKIKSHKNLLKQSVIKLKSKHQQMYGNAKTVLVSLKDFISQLITLYSFVHKHKNFFHLHKLGIKIAKNHRKDIEILVQKIGQNINEELKNYIRETHENNLYPYFEFIESLNHEITLLENGIKNLACHYPHVSKIAKRLKGKLCKIREIITTDNEYQEQKQQFLKKQQESNIQKVN